MNAALAALAVRHAMLPPSANFDEVDPAFAGLGRTKDGPADLVPGAVLAMAIGMHGQVVTLALRAP